jgi:hypothetical protein
MTMTQRKTAQRSASLIRRGIDGFAAINYAQHKLDAIRTNSDSYLPDADRAPKDYAEFLFRTSGVLVHEPAGSAQE